jgi:hypothetical protein
MRSVIYLEKGQFRITGLQEWLDLINKYRIRAADTAKYVDIDLSLFNAMSGYSLTRHAQNVLKELYYGN